MLNFKLGTKKQIPEFKIQHSTFKIISALLFSAVNPA